MGKKREPENWHGDLWVDALENLDRPPPDSYELPGLAVEAPPQTHTFLLEKVSLSQLPHCLPLS